MLNVITSPPAAYDLERFWKLVSLGINADEKESSSKKFLEVYQKKSIEYKDGRYSAKLPWKQDHPLPSNYDVTKRRTERPIKRLRQEPEIIQQYNEIIADQERRDFIEKIEDRNTPGNQVHYIPHHEVTKDSSSTPIRIVYDCSFRQSRNSPSLNDCLE